MKDFVNGIARGVNTPFLRLQGSELDSNLDGGLYEGVLYYRGYKLFRKNNTLALQIADQIAKGGRDVLIFSLEMARSELIAKSISRLTAELAIKDKQPITNAKNHEGHNRL